MADEEYDFFAPQPKPQPRQKNTMFDVVPDAFSPKTLEFTGDHRRVKRVAETSTPATDATDAADEKPIEEPSPVEETIKQYVVTEVEAEKWEGTRSTVVALAFTGRHAQRRPRFTSELLSRE